MTRLTLTFDNGPAPGATERILGTLGERGLPATFFMVGARVAEPAGRRTAERVREAGHAIGNHTMSHGEPLGISGAPARVRAEIGGAHEALGDLLEGERLFRPNGNGTLGPHLLSAAAVAHLTGHGYTVVTWNAVPRDWEPGGGWVGRAHEATEAQDWSVLVLHDQYPQTAGHLASFLDAALARGVEIRPDFPDACVPIRHGRIQWPLDELVTPSATA